MLTPHHPTACAHTIRYQSLHCIPQIPPYIPRYLQYSTLIDRIGSSGDIPTKTYTSPHHNTPRLGVIPSSPWVLMWTVHPSPTSTITTALPPATPSLSLLLLSHVSHIIRAPAIPGETTTSLGRTVAHRACHHHPSLQNIHPFNYTSTKVILLARRVIPPISLPPLRHIRHPIYPSDIHTNFLPILLSIFTYRGCQHHSFHQTTHSFNLTIFLTTACHEDPLSSPTLFNTSHTFPLNSYTHITLLILFNDSTILISLY